MSRDFRDDVRDERPPREVDRPLDVQAPCHSRDTDLFDRHLDLPRGQTRERIDLSTIWSEPEVPLARPTCGI